MAISVARRGVLQAGALTGGLALAGLAPSAAQAALPASDAPCLEGTIGEHIHLDLARGAVIRLTQLDPGSRPLRELALVRMTLAELYDGGRPGSIGSPLRHVCNRAMTLALNVAAANWQVSWQQCLVDGRSIAHPPSGKCVGYKRWVDIV
jgi:hypothetical protein